MSNARFVLPAFAAIALAASGCGGGGHSKSSSQTPPSAQVSAQAESNQTAPTGKPLTRGELVRKANAICKGIVAKLNANPFKSLEQLKQIAPPLANFEREALVEMRKLNPPASLVGDWTQIVASVRILAENTTKMGEILSSGSTSRRTLASLVTANYKARQPAIEAAERDGMHECAEVK